MAFLLAYFSTVFPQIGTILLAALREHGSLAIALRQVSHGLYVDSGAVHAQSSSMVIHSIEHGVHLKYRAITASSLEVAICCTMRSDHPSRSRKLLVMASL